MTQGARASATLILSKFVWNILPHWGQEAVCLTLSIPWLLVTWRQVARASAAMVLTQSVLHHQYHGCWWPGDKSPWHQQPWYWRSLSYIINTMAADDLATSRHGISSHGIDAVCLTSSIPWLLMTWRQVARASAAMVLTQSVLHHQYHGCWWPGDKLPGHQQPWCWPLSPGIFRSKNHKGY